MFDVCILNAGPIAPQQEPVLPLSPAERIVNAEMRQLARLMQLRLLTVFDLRNSLLTVANLAQAVTE